MSNIDAGYLVGGLTAANQVAGAQVDPRLGGALGLAASAIGLYAGVAAITAGGPISVLLGGALMIAGAPVSATLAGLRIASAGSPERLAALDEASEVVDIVTSPAGLAGFTAASLAGAGKATALHVGSLSALAANARCLTEPFRDFNSGYDAGAFVVGATAAALSPRGAEPGREVDRPRGPESAAKPRAQDRPQRDHVDRDPPVRAAPSRPDRSPREAPDRSRADRPSRDHHVERMMDRATERAFTRDMNFDRPRFDRPGGGNVRFGVM